MPLALLALALGAFGIGLTEFVIMGLLPEVAADFGVSIPIAGYLISGYALSVVFGAIIVTAIANRFPRKQVLMGLLVLFILGNLVSAIAPTYAVMMAGRIIAALCHGAFFGIGAVVAAGLVSPSKRAGAIAAMFTGLTFANVAGVPMGRLIGLTWGWRASFWAITAIGVLALAGIARLVPQDQGDHRLASSMRSEFSIFRNRQIWYSIAVTVLGFGGMFGAFTYITPLLTDVTGYGEGSVMWLLALFGVGLFAGNLAGGLAADRSLTMTLAVALVALAATLVVFAVTAHDMIPAALALFLMGVFGFGLTPGLQMRVMHYAGTAPTLASGANIGAFNLGNALGAWLGGLTIAAGLGYTSPLWVGTAMTVAALGILALATRQAHAASPSLAADGSVATQAPITPGASV